VQLEKSSRRIGPVLVCPCCIAKVAGVPDFSKLRVGQTMQKVGDEWITTDGEA
jgi:hypothetical protein